MRARSHHYIPEFHLRMFANDAYGRCAVFDKKWGKYGRPPVASSAVERDYYVIPGSSPDERLRVEREFGKLENRVAPLFRRLERWPPGPALLSEDDRDALAGYAAILYARVPAYRSEALARAREMAKDVDVLGLGDPDEFREAARARGMDGSDERLEELRVEWADRIATGRTVLVVHAAATLTGLTTAYEKVRPMLVDRQWEFLRRDGWPGFVIGDQPVALASNGRLLPSIGFGTPDVQVMMALSPRTLLVISDKPRERVLEVKTESDTPTLGAPWWATANAVAWASSQRWIWGHRRTHLQATEMLIPPEYRRRDLRVLDEATQAEADEIAAKRRLQWLRARREARIAEAATV